MTATPCSTPFSASFYADDATSAVTPIIETQQLARDTYRVRVAAPEIARRITPGQFVMVRLAGRIDPLLARPFALYDVVHDGAGRPWAIDVVYLVVGKMTAALAAAKVGDELEVWGPLGNGFSLPTGEELLMAAGGIGQTPFLALGKEALGRASYGDRRVATPAARVRMLYGVRTADLLAGANDFRAAGIELSVSSDDGSIGHHGFVTDLLRQALDENSSAARRIAVCGPEKMMERVAEIAAEHVTPCEVSLETPMACGIGICFTCVAKIKTTDGWDYKRTCVEGPVFDAARVVW